MTNFDRLYSREDSLEAAIRAALALADSGRVGRAMAMLRQHVQPRAELRDMTNVTPIRKR